MQVVGFNPYYCLEMVTMENGYCKDDDDDFIFENFATSKFSIALATGSVTSVQSKWNGLPFNT